MDHILVCFGRVKGHKHLTDQVEGRARPSLLETVFCIKIFHVALGLSIELSHGASGYHLGLLFCILRQINEARFGCNGI